MFILRSDQELFQIKSFENFRILSIFYINHRTLLQPVCKIVDVKGVNSKIFAYIQMQSFLKIHVDGWLLMLRVNYRKVDRTTWETPWKIFVLNLSTLLAGFQIAIRDSRFATRFQLFTNHFSRKTKEIAIQKTKVQI